MSAPGSRGDSRYRVVSSEVLAQGRVAGFRRERIVLPNGHETEQDVFVLPDAVAVVPIDVRPDGTREVVLIEQFRNPLGGWIHEIPAGLVDDGESIEIAAARELEEETGLVARRISHLASLFQIPGTSRHRLHFFLAEELEPGTQRLDGAECVEVKRFAFAPLVDGILRGDPASPIVDTKTHLALLHAWQLRVANREAPRGKGGGGQA